MHKLIETLGMKKEGKKVNEQIYKTQDGRPPYTSAALIRQALKGDKRDRSYGFKDCFTKHKKREHDISYVKCSDFMNCLIQSTSHNTCGESTGNNLS